MGFEWGLGGVFKENIVLLIMGATGNGIRVCWVGEGCCISLGW